MSYFSLTEDCKQMISEVLMTGAPHYEGAAAGLQLTAVLLLMFHLEKQALLWPL
jgi:hypothetical protein